MKACIYVFSGTGNSLSIAEKINGFLQDSEIRLIPNLMKNALNKEIMADCETIGFVFPNYFGGIPTIVSKFIEIINLEKVNYIFAVITAGGGQGYSLKFLEKELAKKDKKLSYGKYVAGLSNYIVGWYYSLLVKTGKKRNKIIQKLEHHLEIICNDILCKKNEVEKSKFIIYMINRILTPKRIRMDTRSWDVEFTINENCIGCKTCEKVCQVKNIIVKDGKPYFQHNCQRCMACIQYCPKNAIGYKGKPLKKQRSFHPDYPAEKFINAINSGR